MSDPASPRRVLESLLQGISDGRWNDTADPEVVVAEFDYDGRVATTGHSFRVANIQVLRVRGGRIVSSRDYHDHMALAAAVGRLQGLISSIGSPQTGT